MSMGFTRRHFLSRLAAGGAGLTAAPAWATAPLESIRPKSRPADLLEPPKGADLVKRAGIEGHVAFVVAHREQNGRSIKRGAHALGPRG